MRVCSGPLIFFQWEMFELLMAEIKSLFQVAGLRYYPIPRSAHILIQIAYLSQTLHRYKFYIGADFMEGLGSGLKQQMTEMTNSCARLFLPKRC